MSARSRDGRDHIQLRLRLSETVGVHHSHRLPPLRVDLASSERDHVVDLLGILVNPAVRVVLNFTVLGSRDGRGLDGSSVLRVVGLRRGKLRDVLRGRRAGNRAEIGLQE